jgi:hypothetical protein
VHARNGKSISSSTPSETKYRVPYNIRAKIELDQNDGTTRRRFKRAAQRKFTPRVKKLTRYE